MTPGLFATLVAAMIVLAGTAVLALIYLISTARESARLRRRLTPGAGEAAGLTPSSGAELMQTLAVGGKKIESLVDSDNESARLLVQAGWRGDQNRIIYYASQVITPLVLLGLMVPLALFGPPKLTQPLTLLAFGLAAAMLGVLLPRMVLKSRAAARVRRIKSEVPLFIHLLVLLFEAGLSTRQAFASMVRDGRGVLPELGKEFELVLRHLEAGGETDDALKNLAASIALEDLTSTLALLRQVDRYGGEVRDPLLETLKVIEERRSMDMREMVNLMSGRMTVVMVLFFFPALLIFVAGPAFLSVLKALGGVSAQ
ncbi:MAG: type II secretion system F family protein [Panacagrimonas sp.]